MNKEGETRASLSYLKEIKQGVVAQHKEIVRAVSKEIRIADWELKHFPAIHPSKSQRKKK